MKQSLISWIVAIGAIAASIAAIHSTRRSWGPSVFRAVAAWLDPGAGGNGDGRDREHAGEPVRPGAENRIELSEQAQQNIGLATTNLELGSFSRTITVP